MGAVPSGTVTFLFTDLEGSTRLWQEDEVSMREAAARHGRHQSRHDDDL
jgi:class 3 adenylate cyclase